MVIAALIIKHKLGLDDRGTVAMISENIYLQYFCGLKSFQVKVYDTNDLPKNDPWRHTGSKFKCMIFLENLQTPDMKADILKPLNL